jgi:hypothetical protein
MILGEVLHCRRNGFGNFVKAAGMEEQLPYVRAAYGLTYAGKGASDFGLEKNH